MGVPDTVSLIPLIGIPAVQSGDDLGALLLDALERSALELEHGDVVVVASKIVSKSEGRIVHLADVTASARALELASITGKDARLVELILGEAIDVVRAVPGVLLVRHRLGFTSANGAIDASNVGFGDDAVLLLPEDPDASATRLRRVLAPEETPIGVVIADTHGRAFRRGNVGVAVGLADVPGLDDRRGTSDLFGRELEATVVPVADLLAAAAGLVTGEGAEGVPAVIVRGLPSWQPVDSRAADLIRSPDEDLFAGTR